MRAKVLGLSVVALASAAPAAAQETKPLRIQLTAAVVHDDNVARSSTTAAAIRGITPEDTIFTPTITVEAQKPFGRQSVYVNAVAGYNFHQENERLDAERIDIRAGVNNSLGPCVTTLEGQYIRALSQLEDLTAGPVDNIETVTAATFSGACGRPVGLALTAEAGWEQSDNSTANRGTVDYTETKGLAGLMYRRPTFGELTLFASASKTEYDDRLTPGGAQDGYETTGAGIRYSRKLGARIEGSVSAGYTEVDPYEPGVKSYEGETYSADLTYRPSSRLQIAGTFAKAVEPSIRFQTTYTIEESYGVQADYRVGSRIRLTLGALHTDRELEGATGAAAPLITEETLDSVFGAIRYELGRRLAITLDARRDERDADANLFDYTSNRVGLSLVATY